MVLQVMLAMYLQQTIQNVSLNLKKPFLQTSKLIMCGKNQQKQQEKKLLTEEL